MLPAVRTGAWDGDGVAIAGGGDISFFAVPKRAGAGAGSRGRIAAGGVEARYAPDHQSHRTPRQIARRKAKAAANRGDKRAVSAAGFAERRRSQCGSRSGD